MVADSLPPYGWSRDAYFKLSLLNQLDGDKSVVKGNCYLILSCNDAVDTHGSDGFVVEININHYHFEHF